MPQNKFWKIQNKKDDPKIGELMLYGVISSESWWGDEVTPKQFKKDLDTLGEIDQLNIFINSPGGDVFASQAIYSMINRYAKTVQVYIDGLAASGASLIAMAGDKIIMPKNAMLMVHNPWTYAVGFASDLRKVADELDKIRESMIPVYQTQTGLSNDDIVQLLDDETWMTADDALAFGFIHEIEEATEAAACVEGIEAFRFRNIPPELVKMPKTKTEKLKPEENPPKERVFDLQKHLAKINQLNQRRAKRHE